MSPRTKTASYAPLFPWLPDQGQAVDSRIIAEFQDMCSRGMDQALGIQEQSIDTAIQLQSQALDIYKNAWSTPASGNLFEMAAQFLASCMEWQMKFLTMMLPRISPAPRTHALMPPSSEGLEHGMDVSVGQKRVSA